MTLRRALVNVAGTIREMLDTDTPYPGLEGRIHTVKETTFAGMATQSFSNATPVVLDGVTYTPTIPSGGSIAIVAAGMKMTAPSASVESYFGMGTSMVEFLGQDRWRRGRWGLWNHVASYDFSAASTAYFPFNPSTNYPYHGLAFGRARSTYGTPNTSAGGIAFQTWWNNTSTSYNVGASTDDVFLHYARSPWEFDLYTGAYSGGWPAMESMTLVGLVRMIGAGPGLLISSNNNKDGSTWYPYWIMAGNNTAHTGTVARWRITTW